MKKIKTLLTVAVMLAASISVSVAEETDSPFSFSSTTDITYSPAKDFIPGSSHFTPINGIYGGAGARETFHAAYTIKTPLGENFLLKDANLVFDGNVEVSPVTVLPGVSATFTPLPFLVFQAGIQGGTGWNLGSILGIAQYNKEAQTYEAYKPFTSFYYKWWCQGLFQFDTGAIFEGDWTHVVMQYTYQIYNSNIAGLKKSDLFLWQVTPHYYNALRNYQCLILAYQMPLVLYRVGCMFQFEKYYSQKNLDENYQNFNGKFPYYTISPLMQFQFSKKDTLACAFEFRSRRSFTEAHTSDNQEPLLKYSGIEWFFDRVALSYTHNF